MTVNRKETLIAALAVTSMALGAAMYSAVVKDTSTLPASGFAYLYYSDVKGERAFGIDANGSPAFGDRYDRATEASKLIELLHAIKSGGIQADCHETGYRPPPRVGLAPLWSAPRDGVLQVFPGEASPPPPRIEWRF